MNNEFKRMQHLAGIKEMIVGDPTKININDLEIGDKLKVKHVDEFIAFVFRVGQVWEVANIDEDREHYRLVNTNSQTSLGFSKKDIKELLDSSTFEYAKGPEVNEMKIGHPLLINFENLKVGDELIVRHVGDNNWGIKYNVGDIWKIIDIMEGWMLAMGHMFYKLEHVNGNKEVHSLYDNEMKKAVDSGVFGYYKKSEVNEMVVRDPRIKEIVDDIIHLDKKFINQVAKMPSDQAKLSIINDFYGKFDDNGIADALDIDYDTLRKKLEKQQYKSLTKLYEELKLMMNNLPNTIGEMIVKSPIVPKGWERLNKEKLESNIKHLRDEIKDGAEIIDGWEPEDKRIYDAVFLVKVNDQYYVEGWKDDEYQIQEGPFPDERSARIEVLKQIDFCMDYWHAILEMQIANPVFKLPEGWNEDEDVGQDPDNIWDGKIVKSWWAPMNGDDEEHADRIILVENDGQYYIHYLFAFSHGDEADGPFSNKSEALKKILEVMNELMGHWNDPDEMF